MGVMVVMGVLGVLGVVLTLPWVLLVVDKERTISKESIKNRKKQVCLFLICQMQCNVMYQCKQYTLHPMYTVPYVHCTLYSVLHCTLCTVHCTVAIPW